MISRFISVSRETYMPSEKRKFGDICEMLASKHLVKSGFKVFEKNYRKKWGEIDLIVGSENTIHFIEVKGSIFNAKYEHKPEDNVHMWKRKRLWRAIQTWLGEHPEYEDFDWQVDIMAVFLDLNAKKAKIRWTKNVILE